MDAAAARNQHNTANTVEEDDMDMIWELIHVVLLSMLEVPSSHVVARFGYYRCANTHSITRYGGGP